MAILGCGVGVPHGFKRWEYWAETAIMMGVEVQHKVLRATSRNSYDIVARCSNHKMAKILAEALNNERKKKR